MCAEIRTLNYAISSYIFQWQVMLETLQIILHS